jgi:GNAT superfamily N-acetyltransferase
MNRERVTPRITIRAARHTDIPLLFSLIVELADYERARDRVLGSEQLLEAALFGTDPVVEAVIAELDGSAAGFALFFRTFSTWLCRPGMWLEDLYVSPAHRRAGIGRALLSHLAGIALRRGYGRMEWSALHWNTPALDFYDVIGAARLDEWLGFRLEGESLGRVAEGI